MTERVNFWELGLFKPLLDGDVTSEQLQEVWNEFDARHKNALRQIDGEPLLTDRYPSEDDGFEKVRDLADLDGSRYNVDRVGHQAYREGRIAVELSDEDVSYAHRNNVLFRVCRWSDAAGSPYELPAGLLPRKPVEQVKGAEMTYLRAANTFAEAHAYGIHIDDPSIYCHCCTPVTVLAFLALEHETPPAVTMLAERTQREIDAAKTTIVRARGTVGLTDLLEGLEHRPASLGGIVPAEGVTILAGARSSLKTFVALWLTGEVVGSGGRVQFVAGEPGQLPVRLSAVADQIKMSLAGLAEHVDIVTDVPDLYEGGQAFDDVLERQQREQPALLVIDHLGKAAGDADQDKAGPMGRVLDRVEQLAKASGGAVLLLAHTGKDSTRGVRGSGAIEDRADMILQASRHGCSKATTLRVTKNRDGKDGHRLKFAASITVPKVSRVDPDTGSPFDTLALEFVGEIAEPVADREDHTQVAGDHTEADAIDPVLEALQSVFDGTPVPVSAIAAAMAEAGTEVSSATLRRRLTALANEDQVNRTGEKQRTRYTPAPVQ